MKKLIFILTAAAAMSCGDGSNRSSERDDDMDNDADKTQQAAPDTATNGGVQSDTTTMYDRDRDAEVNNPDNSGKEKSKSGTNSRDTRNSRSSQKDSIK
jgi:hypothetical protein